MSKRSDRLRTTRYSWRPTENQLAAIETCQFEGEAFQALCIRLLRYLAQEIEAGRTTGFQVPPDSSAKVSKVKSFRADAIAQQLITEYQQESPQRTLVFLMGWAASLPRVEALQSADKALEIIRALPGKRILTADAKERLIMRCTIDKVRKYLWTLHEAGKIRLVYAEDSTGVALGPKRTTYTYIEFPDRN